MFRAIVFSIVLTVAASPSTTLLCKVWCDRTHGPQTAAASGCHHRAPAVSARVAGDDACESLVLGVAAFLREDVRRLASAPARDHAVVVPRYQFANSTANDSPHATRAAQWALEKRPLSTALRI